MIHYRESTCCKYRSEPCCTDEVASTESCCMDGFCYCNGHCIDVHKPCGVEKQCCKERIYCERIDECLTEDYKDEYEEEIDSCTGIRDF